MASNEHKHDHLRRVARRVADYERSLNDDLRGFSYSTDPTGGGEATRKYVFQDGQVVGIDAALSRICLVADLYGLDGW